jgi:CHAT domain-containing protein
VAGKEDLKPRLIVRDNGEELNGKYLKNYLNAIKFQRPDQYSYAQYWQDIEAATANKTQLYVSLDGVYNQISLNTLQNPKTEKYVVDEKTLIFLTNMKDLLAKETKKPSTSKDIVLIGNPFYGLEGKIPALPGTKVEIEDIAKIMKKNAFKVTQITGKDANETAIKHFSKSPFILHIATHGFFVPDVEKNKQEKLFGVDIEKAKQNPMLRSGLMLADAEKSLRDEASPELKTNDNGILTAYEMMSLHLENTFLVSMSACETGLGEVKAGEGVYGLQRGVQLAGCPNIMMSLWKVSDTATQKFMSLFFTYYTESNNKITAFSQAMRELKKAYPEPYFWGAFVLIGK